MSLAWAARMTSWVPREEGDLLSQEPAFDIHAADHLACCPEVDGFLSHLAELVVEVFDARTQPWRSESTTARRRTASDCFSQAATSAS